MPSSKLGRGVLVGDQSGHFPHQKIKLGTSPTKLGPAGDQ